MTETKKRAIRIVTAASLYDGHDASINIMRRLFVSEGAEVIHLGHDRSVAEIVQCALQEDAHAIAITSYQGGHVEFFEYARDLLVAAGAGHVRIFGGGGGTILPDEITRLHGHGITRVYSPDDGRSLGLEGMIRDAITRCDSEAPITRRETLQADVEARVPQAIAQAITLAEAGELATRDGESGSVRLVRRHDRVVPVVGITGTGGAGKSTLTDELVRRFLADFPDKHIGVVLVDPSKRKTGGALLGDRIRMNAIDDPRVYVRSMATREANVALSRSVRSALDVLRVADFDLIIVESAGIGQSDSSITEIADVCLYVMTPEYGAASQLEKIDMLDFADLVAINKLDKRGGLDALRDVRKQVQRNRKRFTEPTETMPVYGCIASQFGDPGTNRLYRALVATVADKTGVPLVSRMPEPEGESRPGPIVPPERGRYLAEIAETIEKHEAFIETEARTARLVSQLDAAIGAVAHSPESVLELTAVRDKESASLAKETIALLAGWPEKCAHYEGEAYSYVVRGKTISVRNESRSLADTRIPKVALPRYEDPGEIVRWSMRENVPGEYPFTGGVYPRKRENEDPTRMFAGEGGPERTNRRFHYVSRGMPASRLSTAFDSVTLYGQDPATRPDVYGKIGNSGVSIATVDDAKKLYSGFDLTAPTTSVSMTINGPAPMVLAFFMNAAIDQVCEKHIRAEGLTEKVDRAIDAIYAARGTKRPRYDGPIPEGTSGLGLGLLGVSGDEVLAPEVYERCKSEALATVRGTVQADILKEDQAQNTCIFSTEFALRMMGDVQASFVSRGVRNFYSVSVSGYHMAEAGANPITQLAFTLANGFTLVEYYLARGMTIDDFAPNFSFFFSNGIDAEYAVIGRVARRIWARAMKLRYGATERSQMLKYHVQTSGRSLHAQEIDFNDIRTTLQALYAIYDNCNSLHTNAYDEAITTPTEESVRRALAIQLIINKELGLAKNENPLQGSFVIEALTDIVEKAVLAEMRRLDARGGVLGAMETMYQRSKIQEESMHYEMQKHSGEYPLIGVNTFLGRDGSPTVLPREVFRSTDDEKQQQIANLEAFKARSGERTAMRLAEVKHAATSGGNLFEALLDTVKVASLGQISGALYDVGGKYRRAM